MNKVISIHLNGKSYQIEESGYEALRAYLDEAGRYLAENPDKIEIIQDLEQAIAEKCSRYLNIHKDVVTTTEVETILVEMGPVSGEEHANSGGASDGRAAGGSNKKLYLMYEGAVIGGVCAGLAAYLNVDVTLVRIAFVALAVLTGGGFILAYIAAMILVPYAKTSEEKAAAHGLPFNAQELVNRARAQYREFADSGEWRDQWKEWRKYGYEWRKDVRAQRAAHRAMKPRTHVLGLITLIIAVAWLMALGGLITSGTIFGFPLPATIPLWVAIVILFVLFHAVTGPLKGARDHDHSDPWSALVDGIGILFIAIAFGFAYIHYPSVRDFVDHIPTYIHDWYLQLKN